MPIACRSLRQECWLRRVRRPGMAVVQELRQAVPDRRVDRHRGFEEPFLNVPWQVRPKREGRVAQQASNSLAMSLIIEASAS